MLALCTGRDLTADRHFAEVDDAAADANPEREFTCPTCGSRLAGFDDDTRIAVEAEGFDGTIATFNHDHPDRGWVYVNTPRYGVVLVPVNRLVHLP